MPLGCGMQLSSVILSSVGGIICNLAGMIFHIFVTRMLNDLLEWRCESTLGCKKRVEQMTTLASAASLCLLAPNSAPGQTGNKRRIPKKALNSDTAFIVSLCLSAPCWIFRNMWNISVRLKSARNATFREKSQRRHRPACDRRVSVGNRRQSRQLYIFVPLLLTQSVDAIHVQPIGSW